MTEIGDHDLADLAMDRILANPGVSHALKAVFVAWSNRDCVDAARDAEILSKVFARVADLRLGRAS